MIFLSTGVASAILPGDVVFFNDKRGIHYVIVEDTAAASTGVTVLGRAFPDAAAYTVELRLDETVGIVRGLDHAAVATFKQYAATDMPERMAGWKPAEEARRP